MELSVNLFSSVKKKTNRTIGLESEVGRWKQLSQRRNALELVSNSIMSNEIFPQQDPKSFKRKRDMGIN
jgi:hypothetical protein